MPDTGAMIALVEASAGRRPDLIVGKPNRLIVQAAAERAGVPLAALCMIGDRLYTDIALGQAAGIPAVLVLSGETQALDVAASPHQPDFVFPHLGALADALADSR
jgi:NagD protein